MPGGRTLDAWPDVPTSGWADTCATVQLVSQMVGKIRLALSPMENHWWQVTLYPTARGLGTPPLHAHGRVFSLEIDLVAARLRVVPQEGRDIDVPLGPRPISETYAELVDALERAGARVRFRTLPDEVEDPIPFERDDRPRVWEPEAARALARILTSAERVLRTFRSGFLGKCSPVHFFWGAGDLAVTRFSGRRAPTHPGGVPNLADHVTREAYSHEVSSCGWWPGGGLVEGPAFYAYSYPEPAGLAEADMPDGAYWHADLREFILPYAAVRAAADPDGLVLGFCEAAYAAGADLAGWDRATLERHDVPGGGPA